MEQEQEKFIIQVKPVIDYTVRKLCINPYPGHKKGCPNFGKKDGCPPESPRFADVYNLSKPVYAIINKFDLKGHVQHLKELYPKWSQKKLECCLYWQPKARKQLSQHIKYFLNNHSDYRIERCPEAMGINITDTLKNNSIDLEWPPKQYAYQVALAGVERKCKSCGCTWFNGCRNGCYWVENDLCSNCE